MVAAQYAKRKQPPRYRMNENADLFFNPFKPRLAENPRVTQQTKETFLKTINAYVCSLFRRVLAHGIGRSRSSHRTVTASNDFALIARGLSGTSYAAGQVL
jgi:hypothetical protein